jgi:Spy/CpxP family protein refolding chaperone
VPQLEAPQPHQEITMNTSGFFTRLVCTSALLAITGLHQASVFADTPGSPIKAPAPGNAAKQPDAATLSPEQRKVFQDISKEMYENIRASQALQEEIRAITESDAYDEKKVRQLVQKRHKEAEESIVKSSREMHAFYKSLTPEQKKRFDVLRDQMKERHRKEMKDRAKEKTKTNNGSKPASKPADKK